MPGFDCQSGERVDSRCRSHEVRGRTALVPTSISEIAVQKRFGEVSNARVRPSELRENQPLTGTVAIHDVDGKKSGSDGDSRQGGTTAQKKAAGRKGGRASARKRS